MEDISRTLFLGPDARLFQQVVEQAHEEKEACRMCHSGETQNRRHSNARAGPGVLNHEMNSGRPIKTSLTNYHPIERGLVRIPGTPHRHFGTSLPPIKEASPRWFVRSLIKTFS